MIRTFTTFLLFWLLSLLYFHSKSQPKDNNITELKFKIEKVLEETNTPAVGIALVDTNGPFWVVGLGQADIINNIQANENTLFRVGSISKMLVALSILKLQEQNKLNLQDKVRDWVPEIKFVNKWEESNPVRIVHLLEHTTGWDDWCLVEIAHNDSTPISLKAGLDYHPHSRISRWVPGTRMAYCNSGPSVAAYIVEKVSGQKYEHYVRKNFFDPLKMKNTTFFNDDAYKKMGATLYDMGVDPLRYKHSIQRPAGSVNSSASEMANFLYFLIKRGSADTLQLVESESLSIMEAIHSTPGAKAGLQTGYGLANSTSSYRGVTYYGHTGSVQGALAVLEYLPEHKIGHAIFINSSNRAAISEISDLVRDFEIRSLEKEIPKISQVIPNDFSIRDGYYVQINPRIKGKYFLDRLLVNIYKFENSDNYVSKSGILPGRKTKYFTVSDSQFRTEHSNKISLVKAVDPIAGEALYLDTMVLRYVSKFVVFGRLLCLVLWLFFVMSGGLIWMVALIRFWIRGSSNTLQLSRYPTMTSLLFFLGTGILIIGNSHQLEWFGQPGLASICLLIVSITFVACSVWSLVFLIRIRRKKSRNYVFWHMTILACLHLMVVIYLISFSVIPTITWI